METHKKHFIISAIVGVSIITISLFSVLPLSTTSSTNEGKNWMKNLSDDTLVTSLSLPGSHDSGALHSIGDLSGKCQDLSIYDQLNAGIRFFDIRLVQRNNELKVIHGIVDQKLDFSSVLNDFESFLKENPSEGLIVSIKKESDAKNTSATFDESLTQSLKDYSSIWDLSGNIPLKVSSLRGKIFLISRYEDSSIGLKAYNGWLDPEDSSTSNTFDIETSNLHVQDHYKMKDINIKKEEISKCFKYSNSFKDKLTLNFTSCYFLNDFPPSYAATTAKIINNWLPSEIEKYDNLGIVISDFITSSLTKKIYMRNF